MKSQDGKGDTDFRQPLSFLFEDVQDVQNAYLTATRDDVLPGGAIQRLLEPSFV